MSLPSHLTTPRLSRSRSPASCRTFRWWLIVGWDRSNASLRSQTQASPPGWEATRDISRSLTGSASAFSSGATCPACAWDSG